MDFKTSTRITKHRNKNASESAFRRNLIIISIVHGLMIASLFCLTYIPGCQKKAESLLAPLDLVVEIPPGTEEGLETSPLPPEPEVVKSKAEPEPQPVTIPDVSTPKEKSKPSPVKEKMANTNTQKEPVRTKKEPVSKIQVSKKKVRNPYGSRTSTRMPKKLLTADEIKKRLNAGSREGDHTTDVDDETLFMETVRRTFYLAWIQPASLAIDGLSTKVDIEFYPNGVVVGGRIAVSSGNPIMDSTVMKAVQSVHQVTGLPVWFAKKHRTMRIVFELSGEVR